MDDQQDFKSLQDRIQAALIATTKAAGVLAAEDLSFQRSLSPSVGEALDEQNGRLLSLGGSLLKSAASFSESFVPSLQDVDDVENNWRSIVDVIDSLLEKADTCLDEYTGAIKRESTQVNQASQMQKSRKFPSTSNDVLRTQNILKPQLGFANKPSNHDSSPWKPLLISKPHAIIPLDQSLVTFVDEFQNEQYKHPYETEILQMEYPGFVFEQADPIRYLPTQSTKATFVDSFEGVLAMLEELKAAQEIAVDLEHHDARSYIGLVSLMQISTRKKDWIVDTLKPWRRDLQVLNEVFTDPRILKVFHGAYMDMVWLQRDLGLYVVGLFDTFHASQALRYPGGSLAYLLKRFIDFDADKKYQMADWRIRPLPDEMLFYARADTHFLLFIYDNMRNELLNQAKAVDENISPLDATLRKSKETSLLRYERQVYDEKNGKGSAGWFQMLAKSSSLFSNEQFAVFRAVHSWRDKVARADDDSPNFVMPNRIIFSIAKLIPDNMESLSNAIRGVSHGAKSRVKELLEVIQSAKANGKDGPAMLEVLKSDSGRMTRKTIELRGSSRIPNEECKTKDQAETPSTSLDFNILRSTHSKFWGSTFGSSTWDKPQQSSSNNGRFMLAITLPQSEEAVLDVVKNDIKDIKSSTGLEVPLPQTSGIAGTETIEQPFVIKRGMKRRPDTEEDASRSDSILEIDRGSDSTSEINHDISESSEIVSSQMSRKKKRRKNKHQKPVTGGSESLEQIDRQAGEEEAFDYTSAASILHKKEAIGGSGKKGFDRHYAKSADAPKGMRRLQTGHAGKSLTFKG